MSHILLFFGIVFFALIVSCCLFNAYQSREAIFHATEFGLQFIIEHLTDLLLYVRQQLIQFIQSKFCKENCKIEEVNNNSDLPQYKQECLPHRYTTRIIKRSPLIIYIEQFLTQNETQHLIELAEPLFTHSGTYGSSGASTFDDYRTSSSAIIKRNQTSIVGCIERRFAQFQGENDLERIEPFQVVKYTSDQQYKPHYDWSLNPDPLTRGGQRVTTFFTYLQANCSMGETEFIHIPFNKSLHKKFCDILICDKESVKHGIRFRPIPGNSIFWYNVNEQGQGDYLTVHAGRPPGKNGHKIGLNTWTRESKIL